MMKKRLLYGNAKTNVVVVMLVFALVWLSLSLVFTVGKQETWSDYISTDFETEVVTEENGEQILVKYVSSPEQLAGMFADQGNAVYATTHEDIVSKIGSKYVLTGNIDCSSYTWTGKDLASGVVFDGANYIIKGLKFATNQSVQGFVKTNKGTIQNLTLEISAFTSSSSVSKFGAVCGENQGTIQNCVVSGGAIKHNYTGPMGSIAGSNSGTIKNCINSNISVTVLDWGGGIVGWNYGGGTVTNCYNYASVSTTSSTTFARLGGITGESNASSVLQNCFNAGTVTGSCASNGTVYAGGIVGLCQTNVSHCANQGAVSGGNSSANDVYIGGIVGGDYNSVAITISNCQNRANITATAKQTTSNPSSGGNNVGRTSVHNNSYFWWFTVSRDEMYYTRSISTYRIVETAYAGGIAGKCSNKIENCYSMGNVSGGCSYSKYTISETYETRYYVDGFQNKNSPCYYSRSMYVKIYDAIYAMQICSNTKTTTNCYYSSNYTHDYSKQDSYNYNSGQAYISWGYNVHSSSTTNLSSTITNQHVGYWPATQGVFNITNRWYVESGYLINKIDGTSGCNAGGNINGSVGLKIKLNANTPIKGTSKSNADLKNVSLGSAFKVAAEVNDGYPYLVNLYWEGVK